MGRIKRKVNKSTCGKNLRKQAPTTVSCNSASASDGVKPNIYRGGSVSLHEIRRYQRMKELLLRPLPFKNLVMDIVKDRNTDLRLEPLALALLQDASEAYVVGLFENANLCAYHAQIGPVMPKHVQLAKRIRGE